LTALQSRVLAGQQLLRTLKWLVPLDAAGKLAASRELAERAQAEPGPGTDEAKQAARKLLASRPGHQPAQRAAADAHALALAQ
jgi:hypothetical protein